MSCARLLNSHVRDTITTAWIILLLFGESSDAFCASSLRAAVTDTCTVDFSGKSTLTYTCSFNDGPSEKNNFCLRDDIITHVSNLDNLILKSSGCPDHPYFNHDVLIPGFCDNSFDQRLCTSCSSCCSSKKNATSDMYYLLSYIPRYYENVVSVPLRPSAHITGGKTALVPGNPVGVAVNGVLFFNDHASSACSSTCYSSRSSSCCSSATSLCSAYTLDFDDCGGHSDLTHTYHYHGPPLCLLSMQRATLPAQGSLFLYANTSEKQASFWPATGRPSAMLGYAMDGYPIYGPYNSTGHVQWRQPGTPSNRRSPTLNECGFDEYTRRYHITADYPFMPSCFVGTPGSVDSVLISGAGICPPVGIDNVHCTGTKCLPKRQQCGRVVTEFEPDLVWWVTLVADLAGSIYLVWHFWFDWQTRYPIDKPICAMLPAVSILLGAPFLYKLFYGSLSRPNDLTVNIDSIESFLNDTASTFLAVCGVLFALIVTQLFAVTFDKFKKMKDIFADELSVCHRVVLCIKSIPIDIKHDTAVKLKLKAVRVVVWYTNCLTKEWSGIENGFDVPLERFFGILPVVSELCACDTSNFTDQIADRVIDSLNELTRLKYARQALEASELQTIMWVMYYLLSTSMFLGIVLIYSGSTTLNLTMCYVVTLLIGMIALVIADMDMPHIGLIRIETGAAYELLLLLRMSENVASLDTDLGKRNSIFFAARNQAEINMPSADSATLAAQEPKPISLQQQLLFKSTRSPRVFASDLELTGENSLTTAGREAESVNEADANFQESSCEKNDRYSSHQNIKQADRAATAAGVLHRMLSRSESRANEYEELHDSSLLLSPVDYDNGEARDHVVEFDDALC